MTNHADTAASRLRTNGFHLPPIPAPGARDPEAGPEGDGGATHPNTLLDAIIYPPITVVHRSNGPRWHTGDAPAEPGAREQEAGPKPSGRRHAGAKQDRWSGGPYADSAAGATVTPAQLIQIRGGNLHLEATAGEAAIVAAATPIFQRGLGLVRPAVQLVPASRGRMTRSACLVEVTAHGVIDSLCSVAAWEKFDARSHAWVRVNPPLAVANTILSRAGEWSFPHVAGVVTTPTLRPDGSTLSAAGYDTATRLYHNLDPDLKLRPAVKAPTRADAETALADLRALLAEFPFVDRVRDRNATVSEAVALSGLITPVVRGALSVAPLHVFRAHTAGTGKSYLADVASAISSGRPCPVMGVSPKEQETESRLTGHLLAAYPIVSLDNVNGQLGSDLLCQAIERPLIRLRRLGGSDIIEIENRVTIFATGNNLRVTGDMTRRTIICGLDANVEQPELRKFTGNPVATVLADRGRYVSACLIIVRAYAAAGFPDLLPSVASFEDWSINVRSALAWLGCADPANSMETARDDDPELADLREVIGLWNAHLGAGSFTAKEIVDEIGKREEGRNGEPTGYLYPDLRDALFQRFSDHGDINTRNLGKWLMRWEGRIVDGLRIKRGTARAHGGIVRWMVGKAASLDTVD